MTDELFTKVDLEQMEQLGIAEDEARKQVAILKASTHFSPVLIACGVGDFHGRPFNFPEFAKPEAVFVAQKTEYGRELKPLELPGLWNGGMA